MMKRAIIFTLAKCFFKVTQTVQDQNNDSLTDDNLSSSENPETPPSADLDTSQVSDASDFLHQKTYF